MDSWKSFERNPITHSAAHHVVAIADLLDAFGYARVSDVARMLDITRGSVSVTLKNLKQRGLVVEDERRFLGLSDRGKEIALALRAKKQVILKLLVDVLGVDEDQADVDTCKIEHLISNDTAGRVIRFLRFLSSDEARAASFLEAFKKFTADCGHDPKSCPCCDDVCLSDQVSSIDEQL